MIEETKVDASRVLSLARELGVLGVVVDENTMRLNGQSMSLADAYGTLIERGREITERLKTTEAQAGYHRGKADTLMGCEDSPSHVGSYYYGVTDPQRLKNFVLGYRRAQSEGEGTQ